MCLLHVLFLIICNVISEVFDMQLLYNEIEVKHHTCTLQYSRDKHLSQSSYWPFTGASISPAQDPEGCCCRIMMLCVALILSNNIVHLSWCIPEVAMCLVMLTTQ